MQRFHSTCVTLLLLLASLACSGLVAADSPRVVVLEFEMLKSDLLPGGAWPTDEEAERMLRVAEQVRVGLREAGYEVVSGPDTRAALEAHASTEYLHMCNGCERDIAARVSADWVIVGWAQIVSYLIQNLNVVATQVDDGTPLARSFVDLRGNTDESFSRATAYLLDNLLIEKLQARR